MRVRWVSYIKVTPLTCLLFPAMAEPTCAASPTPRNGMSRQLTIMQLCLWGTETKEGLSDLELHMFIPIFQCSPSHFLMRSKAGYSQIVTSGGHQVWKISVLMWFDGLPSQLQPVQPVQYPTLLSSSKSWKLYWPMSTQDENFGSFTLKICTSPYQLGVVNPLLL